MRPHGWRSVAGRDTLQFSISCIFSRALRGNLPSEVSFKLQCDGCGHALARTGRHGFPRCGTRFLQSWFERYSGVLLHTRTATFQQLPELMSDSTHNGVSSLYQFVSSPFTDILQSLHREGTKSYQSGIGIFRDNTPTSGCTFPLPCSHCDKGGQSICVPLIYAYIIKTLPLVKGSNLHTSWDIKPGCSSKSIHITSVCISLSFSLQAFLSNCLTLKKHLLPHLALLQEPVLQVLWLMWP